MKCYRYTPRVIGQTLYIRRNFTVDYLQFYLSNKYSVFKIMEHYSSFHHALMVMLIVDNIVLTE